MKTKMQIIMSKAHEIRREWAGEFGLETKEIDFGSCLKAAWAMWNKYGELMIKVEALMNIERGLPSPVIKGADNRIWELEEIPARHIETIEYKFNCSFS